MSAEDRVAELALSVTPANAEARRAAALLQDEMTKPRGSLGRLEELSIQLAGIAGHCPPRVPAQPALVVAAGDHGAVLEGVTPWPPEVTATMVRLFCSGRASANALARVVGARVTVLDVGVAADLQPHPRLRSAKVRRGTGDLASSPAMSRAEAARALLAGAGLAQELATAGADLLIAGDMGIGNTTPAACLIAAFTGRAAEDVTGRGTGIDDDMWRTKVKVVERALALQAPDPRDPWSALSAVGGLEHAALAGLMLGGAAARVPLVLDGVTTNAAALVAHAIAPDVLDFLIAGHVSVEPGARVALADLGLEPLLDLGMRLGEGTGGLLAVPIVRAAAATLSGIATFHEAGIQA
ncbi:MAG TPA: nicotinate-nucleotide--dimethylbenzimidazole phosphoribosyltransferase [Actinomycetota bacterium]|nr:nicotinate-nucleotide--dimethylbenzimidazole phosphoribosyltransferase [Actinomycetota bacterium]